MAIAVNGFYRGASQFKLSAKKIMEAPLAKRGL